MAEVGVSDVRKEGEPTANWAPELGLQIRHVLVVLLRKLGLPQ